MKGYSCIVALVLLVCAVGANASQVGGFIVKLNQQPSQRASHVMAMAAGGVTSLSGSDPIYLMHDMRALAALGTEVQYVEPNLPVHALGMPSVQAEAARPTVQPKSYTNDWGMQAIKVLEARKLNITGKGIRVAVVDTGVEANHPALKGHVLTAEGYNFVTESVDATDDNGHGSHVSGIIVSSAFGVAPDAQIIPIKFLDSEGGGSTADAIRAVDFARQKKVNVMSNSWGGPIVSRALQESFRNAISEGIIVVAAAGNDGSNNDTGTSFPANYENVISVAAIDDDRTLADFSNYGQQKVLIGAPGVKIYSSVLGGQYEQYDGTSMAAPYVSGAAALYLSKAKRTSAQFSECIKKVADVGQVPLKIASRGVLNVQRMLTQCQ